MALRGAPSACESGSSHCVTCGDEGILMRVIRVERTHGLAICVNSSGEPRGGEEVATDLVEPVVRGQTLLVHAGVALANLDQNAAAPARSGAPWEQPA
ncbi:MAG TPA: HypC/HybG/HupF family hydrogenase formation chaperone [Solirubrobacteraceae bacterium]|jgi:hydrogenase maturation factor|nr:HypC/HybG/HupF family hydrogenase formation chaperone [Solirubrobacteraceae bacterium]